MKKAKLEVWVLMLNDSEGDTSVYLYQTKEEALYYVYDGIKDNWSYYCEDDDIDNYERDEAIEHYYNINDSDSYTVYKDVVEFDVLSLQDAINKAIGLVTHG